MAVHQLKKLSQMRSNTGFTWIDCMPKHWTAYSLLFSVASFGLFFFLCLDIRTAPQTMLIHASSQLGALRAQVGESYLFSLSLSSPAKLVTGDDQHSDEQDSVSIPWNVSSTVKDSTKGAANLTSKDLSVESQEKDLPQQEDKISLDKDVSEEERTSVEKAPVQKEEKVTTVDTDASRQEKESSENVLTQVEEENMSKEPDFLQQSQVEVEEKASDSSQVEVDEKASESFEVETVEKKAKESESEKLQEVVNDVVCDFSKGQWVYDENYPLYKPHKCPFVDGGFRCVENGRPSDEFQKWRWQPSGCDLPRFDAKKILENLRGKRMVFVGDSIGRNNWESMMCMLSEAVPNKTRIYETNGEPITKHTGSLRFRFEDYNCTVEYYRSPYLVPQGRAPPKSDPKVRSTLKLDQIDWSASKWQGADVVILNSGHWWTFEKTVRSGNYFQTGTNVHLDMDVGKAFEAAMKTVAAYVDKNMDPTKSQVFFRSYAPVHFKGGTWDHGGTCNDDYKPLFELPFVYEDRTSNKMVMARMAANKKNPVTFVNVTYLSELRPDGHSSIWQRNPPSPKNRQDCSHWCLPGVPDTWNEILIATLLRDWQGDSTV